MINAYLFSGLGCDKRAYSRLVFPEGIEAIAVDWLPPQPKETLDHYVDRMVDQLDTTQPFYLIGLSFGGMIACMIAEKVNPVKTIIISSIACREELPAFMKFLGRSGLYKLLPNKRLKKSNPVMNHMFGVKNPESIALLESILKDTDPLFLKWAIGSIVQWNHTSCACKPIRIHGMKDRILPAKKFKPDYCVEYSGHFVVYDAAEEVSGFLAKEMA
jgi:pimeloyl-ACP methyl ester carboxylesterase